MTTSKMLETDLDQDRALIYRKSEATCPRLQAKRRKDLADPRRVAIRSAKAQSSLRARSQKVSLPKLTCLE